MNGTKESDVLKFKYDFSQSVVWLGSCAERKRVGECLYGYL